MSKAWQTNVITYAKKDTTEWNQLWRIDGNRILSYRATNHWQCLDVLYANWRYGPNTGRWNCHGGTNQQWEWVRKDRIVRMGDVPGRITIAPAGGLMFARPLTPEEASAGGIYGWSIPGRCPDEVVRPPDVDEFEDCLRTPRRERHAQLAAADEERVHHVAQHLQALGAPPSGAALERLGWVNGHALDLAHRR